MKAPTLLLCLLPLFAWALEPLGEDELQAVSGQDGIALELALDINTSADGTPLLADCTSLSGPCRLAFSFANRTDQWLVLKGYYGNLVLPTLNLDGAYLAEAGSDGSLFDAGKFVDDGGNCLLPGGSCTTAALDDMAALKLSFPTTSGSYDPGTGQSSGYQNVQMGLTVTGLGIEFGSGAAGYNANANGSFLGLRIADNNGPITGVNVDVGAYIFGF